MTNGPLEVPLTDRNPLPACLSHLAQRDTRDPVQPDGDVVERMAAACRGTLSFYDRLRDMHAIATAGMVPGANLARLHAVIANLKAYNEGRDRMLADLTAEVDRLRGETAEPEPSAHLKSAAAIDAQTRQDAADDAALREATGARWTAEKEALLKMLVGDSENGEALSLYNAAFGGKS